MATVGLPAAPCDMEPTRSCRKLAGVLIVGTTPVSRTRKARTRVPSLVRLTKLLLEFGILFRVLDTIQFRRDQDLRRQFFAFGILDDGATIWMPILSGNWIGSA